MEEIRIVADSSADIMSLDEASFACAPLRIVTKDKEYTDDENLDVLQMVSDLQSYKGKSSTSCPSIGDWLNAFGGAKQVICATITSTLSGSYNAAMAAKKMYEEEDPTRRVFVLDSLSAGPEIMLMVEKIRNLINEGKSFDEVCEGVVKYTKKTGLLFMLESLKNISNNGRVNPIVAKMAGLLGIRLVGKASDRGDLEPLDKCRGEKKAIEAIISHMKELGFSNGIVRISHCFNENAAKALKSMIENTFQGAKVTLHRARGLCSFYAEKGGLLIGFEKAVTV